MSATRRARSAFPPVICAKLVLLDQRLADAALEAVELRLDDAEANLYEALHCDDPRRRDATSMFLLRNTHRASKRGYAVAASAASLEVSLENPAQRVVFSWAGGDSDREMDVIERDGKSIPVPRYDKGRVDDCLEGEVATPAALIEHKDAVVPEVEDAIAPDPVASAPTLPVWPGPYAPPPLVAHLYAPYAPPPRVAPARPRQ
jgi:hypothetical protein